MRTRPRDKNQRRGGPPRRGPHGRPQRPAAPAGRAKPDPRERERSEEPKHDPARDQALQVALNRNEPLRAGEWLWTMREGAERDLVEELLSEGAALRPRRLGPALVASAGAPGGRDSRLELTFARQGFPVARVCEADDQAGLIAQLGPALISVLGADTRYALHVFVPDSDAANPLAQSAEAVAAALPEPEGTTRITEAELRRHGGPLIQICLLRPNLAAIGGMASERALSLWPGGRARMRLSGEAPSRAARKLAEAFAWLGMAPGAGELCVDLGAAPGGWTWLLLDKKARVIAVDPARMDAKLMKNPRLSHVQGSAFDFAPDQPVDWLFCDMVWRPLEVAQMLGRWARRRQTRALVANFKLPMKRKLDMLQRIRQLLGESGYTAIRTRQLYHDREEITLTAHVR